MELPVKLPVPAAVGDRDRPFPRDHDRLEVLAPQDRAQAQPPEVAVRLGDRRRVGHPRSPARPIRRIVRYPEPSSRSRRIRPTVTEELIPHRVRASRKKTRSPWTAR